MQSPIPEIAPNARHDVRRAVRRIPLASLVLAGAALGLLAWERSARRRILPGAPLARIRRSVAIGAPPEAAYALLSDATAVSRLAPDTTIAARSPNRWLWTFALPAGLSARAETVMTDARPGRRLALRSVHGSPIPFDAEFDLFPAADSGETVVTAVVSLEVPPRLPVTLVERPVRAAAERAIAGLLLGLRAELATGETRGVTQLGRGSVDDREDAAMIGQDRELGRVVYGREPRPVAAEPAPPADADALVEEAGEESFPASDPPGYSPGVAIEPDGGLQAGPGKA